MLLRIRDLMRQKSWLPGAVLVLALAVWVLARAHGGGGLRVDRATVPPSASSSQVPSGAGLSWGNTTGASSGDDPEAPVVDPGTDSLGEMLEAQARQLADLLTHLRGVCGAAGAGPAGIAIDAATKCVEDAEAAMGTVDLIRGTVASPAGAAMPMVVRTRWDTTLQDAATTVRGALGPLWDRVGRALASGREAPADARALGHLRDRIGRVLSEVQQ